MAHKDIRIGFEIEGRRFEAVGFLNEGESSVLGDTMLERTAGENGGAIGDEDEAFLSERRAKFPAELRRYYLTTNRRHPGHPRLVSCFSWYDVRWCQFWDCLVYQWDGNVLVLRRCT